MEHTMRQIDSRFRVGVEPEDIEELRDAFQASHNIE